MNSATRLTETGVASWRRAAENHAVVQPERPVVPELDLHGPYAIADPVGRAGHVADRIFERRRGDRLLEGEAGFQRARLLARPGADARVARTGGEIGVRFLGRDLLNRAAHAHLPTQRLPMEIAGGLPARVELAALGAFPVRVEHEAARVVLLHQHHAQIGRAVRVHRGQRHGGGIVDLLRLRLGEPGVEQGERLRGFGEVTLH